MYDTKIQFTIIVHWQRNFIYKLNLQKKKRTNLFTVAVQCMLTKVCAVTRTKGPTAEVQGGENGTILSSFQLHVAFCSNLLLFSSDGSLTKWCLFIFLITVEAQVIHPAPVIRGGHSTKS